MQNTPAHTQTGSPCTRAYLNESTPEEQEQHCAAPLLPYLDSSNTESNRCPVGQKIPIQVDINRWICTNSNDMPSNKTVKNKSNTRLYDFGTPFFGNDGPKSENQVCPLNRRTVSSENQKWWCQ
jgi:hypothetical protein